MSICPIARLMLGAGFVLLASSEVYAACLNVTNIAVPSGPYAPGLPVSFSGLFSCSGAGNCSCTVQIAIDGCGQQLQLVPVTMTSGQAQPFSTLVILPMNLPSGTYQICAKPTCSGCVSLCTACCTCCPCSDPFVVAMPGDVNADGTVNVVDLLAVINAWGTCPSPPAPCGADIAPPPTGNGIVDVSDLLMVINHWS